MLLSVERPNRGSLCLSMTRGHAAAPYGLVQAVLPASDWNMCKRTIVVPQELGRTLFAPRRIPGRRYRVTNSRPRRRTHPSRSEENECNRGTAKRKETKCGGKGDRKSQHPHITVEAGEVIPVATLWRKGKTARGCLVVSPSGGNMAKTSSFEPVST